MDPDMYDAPNSRQLELKGVAVKKVLLINLKHHGDVLLSSPIAAALKDSASSIIVDALVYSDSSSMLDGNPNIRDVITVAKGGADFSVLRRVRREGYDLVVNFSEKRRASYFSIASGAQLKVTHDYAKRQDWLWRVAFNKFVPVVKTPRHKVERNFDLLRSLGLYVDASRYKLFVPRVGEAEDYGDNFVVFHPGARFFHKCMPRRLVADIARELSAMGYTVVLTGSPDDREIEQADYVSKTVGDGVINLVGKSSLDELKGLISCSKCFVGVDSLPVHIAAGLDIPTVAIFGPTDSRTWGPWSNNSVVVKSHKPCVPCNLNGCGGSGVSQCLEDINVPELMKAVSDAVGRAS